MFNAFQVNGDVSELKDVFLNHLRNQCNLLVNNNAPFPVRLDGDKIVNTHIVLYPEILTCWPLTWADWETCDSEVYQLKPPYDNYDIKFLKRGPVVEGIKPVEANARDIR